MEVTSRSTTSAGLILSSVVNHKVRCKLDISCDEYVAADFLHQWRQRNGNKPAFAKDIKRYTGFEVGHLQKIMVKLRNQGILEVVQEGQRGIWRTTETWNQFFNFEEDFELFWDIWQKVGNKQKAKEVYMKVRAEVDKKVLHDAAMAKVKATEDLKYLPHAATWLNPKYKHWEDFVPGMKKENVKQEGDFHKTTD